MRPISPVTELRLPARLAYVGQEAGHIGPYDASRSRCRGGTCQKRRSVGGFR